MNESGSESFSVISVVFSTPDSHLRAVSPVPPVSTDGFYGLLEQERGLGV